eukprot:321465-Amphidinium_carterae.2
MEAKAAMADPNLQKMLQTESVDGHVNMAWEVYKEYGVGNAAEVRKVLGVNKLTQKIIGGVPIVRMWTPAGVLEDAYVFSDWAPGLRRANLKITTDVTLSSRKLAEEGILWTGQPLSYWQSSCQGKLQEMNMPPSISSSSSNSQQLLSLETIKKQRVDAEKKVAEPSVGREYGGQPLASSASTAEGFPPAAFGTECQSLVGDEEDEDEKPLLGSAALPPACGSCQPILPCCCFFCAAQEEQQHRDTQAKEGSSISTQEELLWWLL